MSVVAAKVYKDKIIIGADSQSTSYWHNKDRTNKVHKINDNFVIGGVGYTAHNQLMRLYCETNKPASSRERDILEFFVGFHEHMKKKDSEYKPYNDWLIAFDDSLYGVTNDLLISKVTDFVAIGSGLEYAKAALHLGHSVAKALDVACEMTIYCGRPLEIFEIPLNEKSVKKEIKK